MTTLLKPKTVNVIYERAKFHQRHQNDGETVQEIIADVLKLSKTYNYGNMTDELIRDKLVVGIRDIKVSERMQMDSKLTFAEAKTLIVQNERVKQENKNLREKSTKEVYTPDTLSRHRLRIGRDDVDVLQEEDIIFHVNVISKLMEKEIQTDEEYVTQKQKLRQRFCWEGTLETYYRRNRRR
ncbi:hypothetical protein QE152_g32026 [Popillia japonica]|uniref:Uncharacterized protein n=1 Tax=Popillia japonica TaxID=7064 RepID=A0AAW1J0H0_POPJA